MTNETSKEPQMSDEPKCALCGEPMPEGETMFKFHGYSGPCPKPPLPQPMKPTYYVRHPDDTYTVADPQP